MNKDRLFFFIQACLKNNSFQFGIFLRSFFYKYFFKKFGKNIQIKDGVTFKYPSDIEIGNGCIIGEYCYLVGKSGLIIEENVLIGAGSKIVTSNHNFKRTATPIRNQGLSFKPIHIEKNVWIGFDVKILAGSKISNGNIIGTNSVINKIFETPNTIIAGTPAKIIKAR